ncbi:MAG: helix-turn-helix domain-containing protein [Pseudobdellovibrio sp.]
MHLSTDAERWLSVEEIAHHMGVSKESIYRWAEKRKMPAHKVGRQWKFKTAEIDSWILAGNASEEKLTNEGQNEV